MPTKSKIEYIDIEKLIPYVNNARTHSDEQVAQIAASIHEFGFTNPVLISEDNSIIAGHGRVMAARKIGIEEVPCIRLSHLTEAQRKAYIIADNKLALNAGWDADILKFELQAIDSMDFDLTLTGFDVDELRIAMGFGADLTVEEQKEKSKDPIICPSCGHEFNQ